MINKTYILNKERFIINKVVKSLVIIVSLSIISAGIFIVNDLIKKEKEITAKEEVKEEENGPDNSKVIGVEASRDIEEESFVDLLDLGLNNTTSEDELQNVIHQMSHQKIIAKEKRGKVPLTNKTVGQLHEFLMNSDTAKEYIHIETYKNISKKWIEENFSTVNDDHNAIWNLQNGQIGFASGIMSKENEKEYIQHNYGESFYDHLVESEELIGN